MCFGFSTDGVRNVVNELLSGCRDASASVQLDRPIHTLNFLGWYLFDKASVLELLKSGSDDVAGCDARCVGHDAVLRRHLTPDARARLARIALVEPKRAASIKADLAAMAEQGGFVSPMSDPARRSNGSIFAADIAEAEDKAREAIAYTHSPSIMRIEIIEEGNRTTEPSISAETVNEAFGSVEVFSVDAGTEFLWALAAVVGCCLGCRQKRRR